jgi:type I restriction enzyme, S subunit
MTTALVGEVAIQVRGVSYKKVDASDDPRPHTVGVVRAGNIADGELLVSDLVFVPQSNVSNKQMLRAGDVLIATSSGSIEVVGKAARIRDDQPVAFGAFCKVLRPSSEIDAGYFAHYFLTPQYRRYVSRVAAGANINNLKNSHLDDIEILFPPIEEQRRIAAVLDAAHALRAKRRQALAKLATLTQAIFIDMFGDPERRGFRMAPIGELVRTGITRGIDQPGPDHEGGVPYIKTTDFGARTPLLESLARSAPEIAAKFPRSVVDVGDTVICIRATVGPTLLVTNELAGVNLSRGTARISPSADVLPGYLYAALNTHHFQHQIRRRLRGATFLQIPLGELKELEVLVPSLSLQQELVDAYAGVDEQMRSYEAHLSKLDTLFASLQQRAFRGEL